jgi:6-phosphofructokinase 1
MEREVDNFEVEKLGSCKIDSPLAFSGDDNDFIPNFVNDKSRVWIDGKSQGKFPSLERSFEIAGARSKIYFDPAKTRAGIVTCGGLCPGINNVVVSIVNELINGYKTLSVTGFRYGYSGIVPDYGYGTMDLIPEKVSDWNLKGGSMLGSSRGAQNTEAMVDALERLNINILFTIGGDGTQRGALAIYREAEKRGYKLSVVGVPKTIDNDINYITRTFGFETAVSKATEAINAARIEAEGAPRGIGLVRLMGRHSGYIAAHASLAAGNIDLTLIPESPFKLEGENGLYSYIQKRVKSKGHAVIVVAEGAGQDLFPQSHVKLDASGNKQLMNIGTLLSSKIKSNAKEIENPLNLKYIDPSYIIRAEKASPADAIFCRRLGQNAVHAAMAGRTGMVVGIWSDHFTHVPLASAVEERKIINTDGDLWGAVLQMTGQPALLI